MSAADGPGACLPAPESGFEREWRPFDLWYELIDSLSLDETAGLWRDLLPDTAWHRPLQVAARRILGGWGHLAPAALVDDEASILAAAARELETEAGRDAGRWLGRFAEFGFAYAPSLRVEEDDLGDLLLEVARERLPIESCLAPGEIEPLRVAVRPLRSPVELDDMLAMPPSDWDRDRRAFLETLPSHASVYDPHWTVSVSLYHARIRGTLEALEEEFGVERLCAIIDCLRQLQDRAAEG